jgi:hypothetical protein
MQKIKYYKSTTMLNIITIFVKKLYMKILKKINEFLELIEPFLIVILSVMSVVFIINGDFLRACVTLLIHIQIKQNK